MPCRSNNASPDIKPAVTKPVTLRGFTLKMQRHGHNWKIYFLDRIHTYHRHRHGLYNHHDYRRYMFHILDYLPFIVRHCSSRLDIDADRACNRTPFWRRDMTIPTYRLGNQHYNRQPMRPHDMAVTKTGCQIRGDLKDFSKFVASFNTYCAIIWRMCWPGRSPASCM